MRRLFAYPCNLPRDRTIRGNAATQANAISRIVVSGIRETGEIQRAYSEFSVSAHIEKRAFDRAAFRRVIEEAKQAHQSQSELIALTEREWEVLGLLAQGLANKEISEKLVIITDTVKRHSRSPGYDKVAKSHFVFVDIWKEKVYPKGVENFGMS